MSWIYQPGTGPQIESRALLQSTFLSFAQLPLVADPEDFLDFIRNRTASPVIFRGARYPLAQLAVKRGWRALGLGQVADLELVHFRPTASLLELARRGARKTLFSELSFDQATAVRSIVKSQSPYAALPELQLLFRSNPVAGMRFFALFSATASSPCAYVSISRSSADSWHLEEFIRSRKAPVGAMERLLLEIIELLRTQKMCKFSLGEVPFIAQVRDDDLASARSQLNLSCTICRLGRFFDFAYGSSKLYAFKQKFAPVWTPVYWLAYPRFNLLDLAALSYQSNYAALLYSSSCQSLRRCIPSLPTLWPTWSSTNST